MTYKYQLSSWISGANQTWNFDHMNIFTPCSVTLRPIFGQESHFACSMCQTWYAQSVKRDMINVSRLTSPKCQAWSALHLFVKYNGGNQFTPSGAWLLTVCICIFALTIQKIYIINNKCRQEFRMNTIYSGQM